MRIGPTRKRIPDDVIEGYGIDNVNKAIQFFIQNPKKNEEDFMRTYFVDYDIPIEVLIQYVLNSNLGNNVLKRINARKKQYAKYKKPFKMEEYLGNVAILVNGERIYPTEADVTKCMEYLEREGRIVCNHTVHVAVSDYIKGDLVIPESEASINPELTPETALEVAGCAETFKRQVRREFTDTNYIKGVDLSD